MSNKNYKFVEELKKELIKNREIKAIIVYGSFVSKKTTKSSDIDIIIFVEDKKYEKLIIKISQEIYDLFLKYNPSLFPSINIWRKSDSNIMLPYYLTCLDLKNINVVYDKINFKKNLKSASTKLGKDYLRKELKNGKIFWYDRTRTHTKFIGDFSFKKYNFLKKYADIALKNKDYDATIELNYKSTTFLLTSFLELKGIHLKGKNDSYFLNHLKFSEDINLFLKNYYVILNLRKSSIPFNEKISKDLANKSRKIRDDLEKIYRKSF